MCWQVCWQAYGNFPVSCRRRAQRWNRKQRCVLRSAGYWEPIWQKASSSMWERYAEYLPPSYTLSYANKLFLQPCINLLMDHWLFCLQVVHIFSHIHQTYVVHSVCLKDADTHTQTENAQWLTRSALQEAAVSTGVKKVFILFTQSVWSPAVWLRLAAPAAPGEGRQHVS